MATTSNRKNVINADVVDTTNITNVVVAPEPTADVVDTTNITNVVVAPEPTAEEVEVYNKFLSGAETGFAIRKGVLAAKSAVSHNTTGVVASAKGFLTGLFMRPPKPKAEAPKPREVDPELREMLNGYLNTINGTKA